MKIKILIFNIVFFLFIVFLADFLLAKDSFLYSSLFENTNNKFIEYIKIFPKLHHFSPTLEKQKLDEIFLSNKYSKKNDIPNYFRPIENKEADNSIVIFGCSYAYGMHLEDNQTLSFLLSKEFKNYSIFNRALCSATTAHMLYQLQNYDFQELKNKEDKVFIFVFITDHFCRDNFSHQPIPTPYFKEKKNKFILDKYSFKYINMPLIKVIKQSTVLTNFYSKEVYNPEKSLSKKTIKKMKYSIDLIKESNRIIKKRFGQNSKLVVLRFDMGEIEPYDQLFKPLLNEGIYVTSVYGLTKEDLHHHKYKIENDVHPNFLIWEYTTKEFSKYIEQNKIIVK